MNTTYSYFIQIILHILISSIIILGCYYAVDYFGDELTVFLAIIIGVFTNIALFRLYFFNRLADKEGGTVRDPRRF